jgi:hypothetical protein
MVVIPKITIVVYGLKFESLQMTEEDYPRLDVDEIPLLKDIRCIIKDTKNVAKSLDEKRLNRSPLDIAMNIGFRYDHTCKE